MSTAEQAFWLDHLGGTDRFSEWVASEISPSLGRSILAVGCGIGTFTRLLAPVLRIIERLTGPPVGLSLIAVACR